MKKHFKLREEAYYGPLGEVIKKIEPHTEADNAALISELIVTYGNSIGRNRYIQVEKDKHYTNLNVCIVGDSAKARKGTSKGQVMSLMAEIDPDWKNKCCASGLGSGEGLINRVKDARVVHDKKTGKPEIIPGVTDKRLIVYEGEFASLLKVLTRPGNTLSTLIRDLWDHGNVEQVVKNEPLKATLAHVSIAAHITSTELNQDLNNVEMMNGFANRFLWIFSTRSKSLPRGGNIDSVDFTNEIQTLKDAKEWSQIPKSITFSEEGGQLWDSYYKELEEGLPGLLGAITARAEPTILRLALIYACVDQSELIMPEHLMAAKAIYDYSEASCKQIFALSDKRVVKLMNCFYGAPEGLSKTDIHKLVFHNNANVDEVDNVLAELESSGCIERFYEGRTQLWKPTNLLKNELDS